MASGLLDDLPGLGIYALICSLLEPFHSLCRLTKRVRDKLEGIVVVIDFVIEVSQVEPVSDIILVYFTEVFVPFAA